MIRLYLRELGLISAPLLFSSLPPLNSLEPAFLFSAHLESWTLFPSGNTVLVYTEPLWKVTGYCYRFYTYSKEHMPLSFLFFKYGVWLRDCYLPQGFVKESWREDAPCKLIRNADIRLYPKPANLDFNKTHTLFWFVLNFEKLYWSICVMLLNYFAYDMRIKLTRFLMHDTMLLDVKIILSTWLLPAKLTSSVFLG